ncbi:hypothetical protein [Leucobacter tenebrionis]|uniref:hypothetical protein n=1 Tax=Leucobacter tenebrionis TaxID=2873270 RepID=UPI001CA69C2B|nr:hypothetical protein [Leucobacter tenebrionis]QZY50605.1 hypothetical protein KVY00_08045 [Leucobacter tenebrionis]
MFFEPDTLLAGPRGRRLCFEVAMAAVERMIEADAREQWRASTVRHAARQADPDRPVARAYFGWGAREMPRPRRESSTGSPADALTGIPLARLGDADLLAALTMTVSRAAYWQPPDGEDMLAADPELRGPLLRAAGAIVASPAVAWWLDAFGDAGSGPPRQWAVGWEDEAHHGTGPVQRPVSGVLREWGEHVRACEERSRRERPLDPAAN